MNWMLYKTVEPMPVDKRSYVNQDGVLHFAAFAGGHCTLPIDTRHRFVKDKVEGMYRCTKCGISMFKMKGHKTTYQRGPVIDNSQDKKICTGK